MYRRKKKLIQPRLQLTLCGWFLAVAVLGLLLQYLLLGAFLAKLAASLPENGAVVAAEADRMLLQAFGWSMLFLVPVTAGVGILATFRIAGPIYRFEAYFGRIAKGEEVGPCRIRKGDELHELCRRINAAIEVLKARGGAADAGQAPEPEREAA